MSHEVLTTLEETEPPAWARDLTARVDILIARIDAALAPARTASTANAKPVLTSREAAAYLGFTSLSPLYAWARRWHVKPCGHGQWARHSLDAGRQRQADRGRRIIRADDRRQRKTA